MAWFWLWRMEIDMPGMAAAVYAAPWTLDFGIMILGMWGIMMAAMMTPVALPMLLLVAGLKGSGGGSPTARTAAFASGYLLIWGGFSGLAAALQWLLNGMARIHGAEFGAASQFSSAVLVLAGLYQWSPWKNACLRHCQTPMGFLLSHWRDGRGGALRMGMEHGLFCLGCCWLLMALMLVGGAMNLAWMSAITVYLLSEQSLPSRFRIQKISGSLLIGVGMAQALRLLAIPGSA